MPGIKPVVAIIALLFVHDALSAPVSEADRKAVLAAVISHLQTEYVDPDVGRRVAKKLREKSVRDMLANASDGAAMAEALRDKLREETGDGHLNVEYSEQALPDDQAAADAEFSEQEMERYYGAQVNFGVRKAERLENNIGLLDLAVFPPASMGGDTVAAAMQVIAHTDALIIDLRRNGGGMDTVSLVASYLFDDQQPLSGIYDRPSGKTTQNFTQPYVPGARFGGTKPVYVLTSKRTFSAAEALAYDLQALKRATIIGQPSGGGAHPFTYRRIHPHFVLWSVVEESVNPITGKNWQGVGVQPDVVIDPAQALDKALELIAANNQRQRPVK
ncbi:MAG: S41 family peptidase [Pseudomonadota bacterium]|nr:S41 family peptidase [Pseudomonadota bacterium]